MNSTARKLALPAAFLAVGLPLGIGAMIAMGDPEGAEKAADKAAFKSVSTTALGGDDRRAEARWEKVTSFTGTGSLNRSFEIADGAIQSRTKWLCRSGKLRLSIGHKSQEGKVVANTKCPDAGEEISVGTGPGRVEVEASGRWRMAVEQQVDTALKEPPLAGMTKASLLARGRFRGIQKRGEGTVSLFRLPSGRLALRYKNFYTAPSPGLELWLSRARKPNSTLDARRVPHINAGRLKSTFGSYNQLLPRGTNVDQFNSIVVWCPTVLIAFGGAPLE